MLALAATGLIVGLVIYFTRKNNTGENTDEKDQLPPASEEKLGFTASIENTAQKNEFTSMQKTQVKNFEILASMNTWSDVVERINKIFPDNIKITEEEDDEEDTGGDVYFHFELSQGTEIEFFNISSAELFGFIETKLSNKNSDNKKFILFSAHSPRMSKANDVRDENSSYTVRRMHNIITLYRKIHEDGPSRHIFYDCLQLEIVDIEKTMEGSTTVIKTPFSDHFEELKQTISSNSDRKISVDDISVKFDRKKNVVLTFLSEVLETSFLDSMISEYAKGKFEWQHVENQSNKYRKVYLLTFTNKTIFNYLFAFNGIAVSPNETYLAVLVPSDSEFIIPKNSSDIHIYNMTGKTKYKFLTYGDQIAYLTDANNPNTNPNALFFDKNNNNLYVAYTINSSESSAIVMYELNDANVIKTTTFDNLTIEKNVEKFQIDNDDNIYFDNDDNIYFQDGFQKFKKKDSSTTTTIFEKPSMSIIFDQLQQTSPEKAIYVHKPPLNNSITMHTISFVDKQDVNTDSLPLALHHVLESKHISYVTVVDKLSKSNNPNEPNIDANNTKSYLQFHIKKGEEVEKSVLVYKLHKKNFSSTTPLSIESLPVMMQEAPCTRLVDLDSNIGTANVFETLLYKDGVVESIVPMYVEVRLR